VWPRTDRLVTTLAAGGTVVSKVDILVDGILQDLSLDNTDPDFVDLGGPVDGRVDVQRATIRRTGSIALLDLDRVNYTQGDARDLLVPYRSELRPWRGAIYSDATTEVFPADRELVPLGTLVVVDVDLSKWPLVQVECRDRMWHLSQLRLVQAYSAASGTETMDAVKSLIASRYPANRLALNLPTTTFTTGDQVWDREADPAEAVHDLAASAGYALYCDPMGTFVATPETDVDTADVAASYVEGAGSMMLMPSRKLSADGVVNAVLATSSAPDLAVPVSGYAQDDDPSSPTYAGAIGVIPDFWSSPLLQTAAQATLAAQTRLRNVVGLSDATAVAALVDPGLEAGDVIQVTSTSRGIDTRLIVDSFSVPLRASESQTLTCRASVAVAG
jgi:hypothetical protein